MSFPYKLDVEPGLKRLSTRSGICPKFPMTTGKIRTITIPKESRTSRAIVVNADQENVIRPLGSKVCKCRRSFNRQKSKETAETSTDSIEKGINTFITGPLQYDKHCLTNVRTRNNCNCKSRNINKLTNGKTRAEEIQTVIPRAYSLVDKACSRCVEMSNCSTQFLEEICESQIDYALVTKDKETLFVPITVAQQVSNKFNEQSTDKLHKALVSEPSNIDKQVSATKEKQNMIPAATSINMEQTDSKNEKFSRSKLLKTTDGETTITLADHDILNHCSSQMRHLRWAASNRWALSQKAVHGPDF